MDGRNKNWATKSQLHGQLRHKKLSNRRVHSRWPIDGSNYKRPLMLPSIVVSKLCPCRYFYFEICVILFYEIKLVFTYFTFKNTFISILKTNFEASLNYV